MIANRNFFEIKAPLWVWVRFTYKSCSPEAAQRFVCTQRPLSQGTPVYCQVHTCLSWKSWFPKPGEDFRHNSGTTWSLRSLPTRVILWFCDSVTVFAVSSGREFPLSALLQLFLLTEAKPPGSQKPALLYTRPRCVMTFCTSLHLPLVFFLSFFSSFLFVKPLLCSHVTEVELDKHS